MKNFLSLENLNDISSDTLKKIIQSSSEMESCPITNILEPEEKSLWLSSEQLPQEIIINLNKNLLKKYPKKITSIGIFCWHAYPSNPKLIEILISKDNKKTFLSLGNFDLFLKPGKQLLQLEDDSNYILDNNKNIENIIIKLIIKETYGEKRTYINNIFLYEDIIINNQQFRDSIEPIKEEDSNSNIYLRESREKAMPKINISCIAPKNDDMIIKSSVDIDFDIKSEGKKNENKSIHEDNKIVGNESEFMISDSEFSEKFLIGNTKNFLNDVNDSVKIKNDSKFKGSSSKKGKSSGKKDNNFFIEKNSEKKDDKDEIIKGNIYLSQDFSKHKINFVDTENNQVPEQYNDESLNINDLNDDNESENNNKNENIKKENENIKNENNSNSSDDKNENEINNNDDEKKSEKNININEDEEKSCNESNQESENEEIENIENCNNTNNLENNIENECEEENEIDEEELDNLMEEFQNYKKYQENIMKQYEDRILFLENQIIEMNSINTKIYNTINTILESQHNNDQLNHNNLLIQMKTMISETVNNVFNNFNFFPQQQQPKYNNQISYEHYKNQQIIKLPRNMNKSLPKRDVKKNIYKKKKMRSVNKNNIIYFNNREHLNNNSCDKNINMNDGKKNIRIKNRFIQRKNILNNNFNNGLNYTTGYENEEKYLDYPLQIIEKSNNNNIREALSEYLESENNNNNNAINQTSVTTRKSNLKSDKLKNKTNSIKNNSSNEYSFGTQKNNYYSHRNMESNQEGEENKKDSKNKEIEEIFTLFKNNLGEKISEKILKPSISKIENIMRGNLKEVKNTFLSKEKIKYKKVKNVKNNNKDDNQNQIHKYNINDPNNNENE